MFQTLKRTARGLRWGEKVYRVAESHRKFLQVGSRSLRVHTNTHTRPRRHFQQTPKSCTPKACHAPDPILPARGTWTRAATSAANARERRGPPSSATALSAASASGTAPNRTALARVSTHKEKNRSSSVVHIRRCRRRGESTYPEAHAAVSCYHVRRLQEVRVDKLGAARRRVGRKLKSRHRQGARTYVHAHETLDF